MNVCLLTWHSGILPLVCLHTKTITVESFAIIVMTTIATMPAMTSTMMIMTVMVVNLLSVPVYLYGATQKADLLPILLCIDRIEMSSSISKVEERIGKEVHNAMVLWGSMGETSMGKASLWETSRQHDGIKGEISKIECWRERVESAAVRSRSRGLYICMGGVITEDGRCEEDVKRRLGLACASFGGLGKMWREKIVSIGSKMKLYYAVDSVVAEWLRMYTVWEKRTI